MGLGRKIGAFFGKAVKKVGQIGGDVSRAVGSIGETTHNVNKITGGGLEKLANMGLQKVDNAVGGGGKVVDGVKAVANKKTFEKVGEVGAELERGGDRFKNVAKTFHT
jgi:hypothetical protein